MLLTQILEINQARNDTKRGIHFPVLAGLHTKKMTGVQKPHMHSAAQKWRVGLLELLPFNLSQ